MGPMPILKKESSSGRLISASNLIMYSSFRSHDYPRVCDLKGTPHPWAPHTRGTTHWGHHTHWYVPNIGIENLGAPHPRTLYLMTPHLVASHLEAQL